MTINPNDTHSSSFRSRQTHYNEKCATDPLVPFANSRDGGTVSVGTLVTTPQNCSITGCPNEFLVAGITPPENWGNYGICERCHKVFCATHFKLHDSSCPEQVLRASTAAQKAL